MVLTQSDKKYTFFTASLAHHFFAEHFNLRILTAQKNLLLEGTPPLLKMYKSPKRLSVFSTLLRPPPPKVYKRPEATLGLYSTWVKVVAHAVKLL